MKTRARNFGGARNRAPVTALLVPGFLLLLGGTPVALAANAPQSDGSPAPAAQPAPAQASAPAMASGAGEVMKMIDAGTDTKLIKSYIETAPMNFQLSAGEIIALYKYPVSSELIAAMIRRGAAAQGQGTAREQPAPAPASPAPSEAAAPESSAAAPPAAQPEVAPAPAVATYDNAASQPAASYTYVYPSSPVVVVGGGWPYAAPYCGWSYGWCAPNYNYYRSYAAPRYFGPTMGFGYSRGPVYYGAAGPGYYRSFGHAGYGAHRGR